MSKRGRPRYPDVLTPRQQEVLERVREGKTNREIASEMGISPDGVKFHVSEILSRTGASRRREAAQWSRDRERPTAMLGGWRTRRIESRRRSRLHRRGARLLMLEQERIAC